MRSVTTERGALVAGIVAMGVVVYVSNVLVEIPINDWLTWGALSYPIAFLVTDLTNRILGVSAARRVVAAGFVVGVVLSLVFADPRIALASGTAFLVADEGGLPDALKDQIVDASTSDMRISPYWTGKTVRAVQNDVAKAWDASGLPSLPTPHQRVLMEDFKEAAMAAGRFEITMNAGGQGAGMITKRRPAAEIFTGLVEETRKSLDRLGRI